MTDSPAEMKAAARASQQASSYREASGFLAWGGVVIAAAYGLDVLHGGGHNWPALAVRLVWAAILLAGAVLLRRARRTLVLAGCAAMIFASVGLELTLLRLTGGAASPLLPFVYVLATILPFMAFELTWIGLLGSVALLGGTWKMLVEDGAGPNAIVALTNAGGGALVCGWLLARAFDRARRAEEARRLALAEAMASVKTLRGLLPVCAWCRRVRSDSGYWQQLEAYVAAHSEAEITHGLCQDCEQKHFGGAAGHPAPGAPPRPT